MKFFITGVIVVCTILAFGQKRQMLNIELQHAIENIDSAAPVDLYLRGNQTAMQSFVRTHDGTIKHVLGDILSCAIPAGKIKELNELEGLDYVEFSLSKPELLNDVMITNNNIHPIHSGAAPLPEAYRGEDVIIGFVDTGLDLAHPDFHNTDGSTRIIALWDHTQPENEPLRVPEPYGYGQEWNAEEIDNGLSNHQDQPSYFGHGSSVAGVGAGNANATGEFIGVAPEADLIVVSSDFNRPNWKASVADAIDFIFTKAEVLGKPAVVNLSLGDYSGSHDGLDASALLIDEMLESSPGRSVVAAAGNSGAFGPYHLSYQIPELDTAFTWFKYNPNALENGAVFFEVWADSADFYETSFAVGADFTNPNYEFRGYTDWQTAVSNLNTAIVDTVLYNGEIMGICTTYVAQRGDQYHLQVAVQQPFSTQMNWRFATTGGGTFDCWSYGPFGTSTIVYENLPTSIEYPDMDNYELPDTDKTIVDSWVCSDKVITVGNYVNRDSFVNALGEVTTYDPIPGTISNQCSRGPTRDNRQKPTIAATGDQTLSAGRIAHLNSLLNLEPHKVAQDSMHYINGGTSLASPVAAGVAALYFQRDPQATYQDVIDAIVDNAFADQYTGVLPGNRFGHGKLDGFAALTNPFGDPTSVSFQNDSFVKTFPNPTNDLINLEARDYRLQSFQLFDLAGRVVQSGLLNQSEKSTQAIQVNTNKPGLYLLRVYTTTGEVSNAKVVIEK
ncbi:MAG: S8 family serine peptidase [Cryomorphaceae bacterium]|nr:S8 family peptidase [Flavobacteriales bacterium]